MTSGGHGISGSGQGGRLLRAFALALMLVWPAAVHAQMFTDRPPPAPPNAGPDAPSAPLTQPSIAVVPPVAAPPAPSTAGQAVLSLTARYGKDLPVITNGLVWRGVAGRPGETGTFKMIPPERGAT